MVSGNTSLSTELLSSDWKEVVSSMGRVVKVCEVSSSQAAEPAALSNFTTPHSRSGRVMRGTSAPETLTS